MDDPRPTSTKSSNLRQYFPLIALAVILVVATALRFAGIADESLWLDEIDSVLAAKLPVSELLTEPAGNKQPFYFLALSAWMGLFGDGEANVRGFSAIFGVLTVAATYFLVCRVASEWAALAASALVTFTAAMLWYSQETRMYTLTSFLLVLSLDFMLRYFNGGRRRDLAVFAVATFLGLYSHYYYIPFTALQIGIGFALFGQARNRQKLVEWSVATGTVSLALLSRINVLVSDLTTVEGNSFTEAPGRLFWRIFQEIGPGDRRANPSDFDVELGFVALLWVAIVAGSVLALRRRDKVSALVVVAFGSTGLMFLAQAVADLPLTLRYFVPLIPVWIVIGVWTVEQAAKTIMQSEGINGARAVTGAGAVVVAVFIGISLVSWTDVLDTTSREQWREARSFVEEQFEPRDSLYVTPAFTDRYFDFYASSELSRLQIRTTPAGWCEGDNRVWMVSTPSTRSVDEVGDSLIENCALQSIDAFGGPFNISLFVDKEVTTGISLTCDGQRVTILGTPGTDFISGTDGPDVVLALGGNDTINAGDGDDVVCAGDGDDVVNASSGNDRVFGDGGDDRINGGPGDDHLRGSDGADTINASDGNDELIGGEGDDTLNAGPGADNASGGNGDDTINAGGGNDQLRGDGGADILRGSTGNDSLDGGEGEDNLNGGDGTDSCVNGESLTACESQ